MGRDRKRVWAGTLGRKAIWLAIGVGVVLASAAGGAAVVGGRWTSTLRLVWTPSLDIPFDSRLTVYGVFPGIDWRSTLKFTQDGIDTFAGSADWSAWVFDFGARVGFLAGDPRMDYLLLDVETMLAGVYLRAAFLLEYESINSAYGVGAELAAEGKIANGITIAVTSWFGLEENVVEQLGWQFGSGYDIIPRGKLANLSLTATEVELQGLSLCSSDLYLKARFTKPGGFQGLELEWSYPLELCSLDLEFRLALEVQTKSLSLRPSFQIPELGCLEVYVRVLPWQLLSGANAITGLVVQGFGIRSDCGDGTLTLAAKTALGGQLYRRRGAGTDIELRAWDYVVEPEPDQLVYYLPTPYWEVWTMQTRNEYYLFSVDLYFSRGTGGMFSLGLVTAELQLRWCEPFSWRGGLAVAPGSMIELQLELSFAF